MFSVFNNADLDIQLGSYDIVQCYDPQYGYMNCSCSRIKKFVDMDIHKYCCD